MTLKNIVARLVVKLPCPIWSRLPSSFRLWACTSRYPRGVQAVRWLNRLVLKLPDWIYFRIPKRLRWALLFNRRLV